MDGTVRTPIYTDISGIQRTQIMGTDGTTKNQIYTDVSGILRTQIVSGHRSEPFKYIFETDATRLDTTTYGSNWKLDVRGREGWYYKTTDRHLAALKWYGNNNVLNMTSSPQYLPTTYAWVVLAIDFVGTLKSGDGIKIIFNKELSDQIIYTIPDSALNNIYNRVPYLFYNGDNTIPMLNPSYTPILLSKQGTDSIANNTVYNINVEIPQIPPYTTGYLIISAGFWDTVSKQEYRVTFGSQGIKSYTSSLLSNSSITTYGNTAYLPILVNGIHVHGKDSLLTYEDTTPTETAGLYLNAKDDGENIYTIGYILPTPLLNGDGTPLKRVCTKKINLGPFASIQLKNEGSSALSGVKLTILSSNI
jgi:hypothetical protein